MSLHLEGLYLVFVKRLPGFDAKHLATQMCAFLKISDSGGFVVFFFFVVLVGAETKGG